MTDLYKAFEAAQGERKQITDEDIRRWMLRIATISNGEYGALDKEDGYNCPKCRNKGFRYAVIETEHGYLTMTTRECGCMDRRKAYERSRSSGLPEGYTFESFRALEDWQTTMRDTASKYVNNREQRNGTWFYAGGAIGAGKTHIVTAMAREIVYDRDVRFMSWLREAREMKSAISSGSDEYYSNTLYALTSAEVLFIDDFFKGTVTDADKKLAYDILNDRYTERMATLITSELTIDQLDRIDSSIASRIYERAGGYMINLNGMDGRKNMRFKTA